MSTLVRKTGQIGTSGAVSRPYGGYRTAFTASNGNALVVIADKNASTAVVGNGERNNTSKIYLYESVDRVTWSLRATITAPSTLANPNLWAAEIDASNNVHIVYYLADNTVRYQSITYGTWAIGTIQTVQAAVAGTTTLDLDVSTTDTGIPVVMTTRTNTSGSTRHQILLYVRRTSDSTWINANATTLVTTQAPDTRNALATLAVTVGGVATARNVVMLTSSGVYASGDHGGRIYAGQINETTGAGTAFTLKATIGAGDIPINHGVGPYVRKGMLWSDATNEVVMGLSVARTAAKRSRMYAARYSWNGTTWASVLPLAFSNLGINVNPSLGMAHTFGTNGINFIFAFDTTPANAKYEIASYSARLDTDGTGVIKWSGHYKWDNLTRNSLHQCHVMSNGARNFALQHHDMVFYSVNSSLSYDMYHHSLKTTPAPTQVTPASGSTTISSVPGLTAAMDVNVKYPQTGYKMVWQFATDSGFTTNLREYEQPHAKIITPLNTNLAGTVVKVSDVLPTIHTLPQGIWWVRAALVSALGKVGSFSAAQSFTVAHPPTATNLLPNNSTLVRFGSSGAVSFNWKFSDPSADDFQTAYQVLVYRVSDGLLVMDSGKITSTNVSHVGTISATYKETQLRFQVILWDRDDVQGVPNTAGTFFLVDEPSLTIASPTSGSTITTALPVVSLTGSVSGTRTFRQYRIYIMQAGKLLYDTGLRTTADQSPTYTLNHQVNKKVMNNLESYTIGAYTIDSAGVQSLTKNSTVTTGWTPPAAPAGTAVDISPFNTEGLGYVKIEWNNTTVDTDFRAWVVYRKVDQIDPDTLSVYEQGELEEIHREYDAQSLYEFRDYYAPSGQKVSYKVTQLVDRFDEEVESANTTMIEVYPTSDGYWLIEPEDPERSTSAMKLGITTDDSYTDEYEENEVIISGRGRHVERGEYLGLSGSLDVQIRNTGGTTARQKKRQLEQIKKENRKIYLRTPFGDVYHIHPGNLGISRLAGVGKAEFVDVTIPYSEVSASDRSTS